MSHCNIQVIIKRTGDNSIFKLVELNNQNSVLANVVGIMQIAS